MSDGHDHRMGFDNDHEVSAIWFPGEDGGGYEVGSLGVTRIEPYNEDGGMSYVPWFIVWTGDIMRCRVNAAHVAVVTYAKEATHAE